MADVSSAIWYKSNKSSVEIGFAQVTRAVTELIKVVQIGINSSRWFPVLAVLIVEQILFFQTCLGENGVVARN